MKQRTLRIGTRASSLAIWQADQVCEGLRKHSYRAEWTAVKSEGDLDLHTPLYEMGVQGIFTRSLDIALLKEDIDLAVHSMKDVPTRLPEGITQAAVLPRGPAHDLIVFRPGALMKGLDWGLEGGQWRDPDELSSRSPGVIATGSLRRQAQWLHRFPQHRIEQLRGNVQTRLQKLESSQWDAALFAAAGLERLNIQPEFSVALDWMLPAPAQGAIMVVCRTGDAGILEALANLHNKETAICTHVERDFLRGLMGGCSTPVGASAILSDGRIRFKGNLLSVEGHDRVQIELEESMENYGDFGARAAATLLASGGATIMENFRHG